MGGVCMVAQNRTGRTTGGMQVKEAVHRCRSAKLKQGGGRWRGSGVGGGYYAADRAEAVAGWEAGRLLERNHESVGGANGDSSRIPRERRRTKIQQKGPWVLGETVASTN